MYQEISFNDDEIQDQNNVHLVKRQGQYAERYTNTITKNFLNKNLEENEEKYQESSPQSSLSGLQKRKELLRQRRKHKNKNIQEINSHTQSLSSSKKIDFFPQKHKNHLNILVADTFDAIQNQIEQVQISHNVNDSRMQENIFVQKHDMPKGVSKQFKKMQFDLQQNEQQQQIVKNQQLLPTKSLTSQKKHIQFLYEQQFQEEDALQQIQETQINIERNQNNILMFDEDDENIPKIVLTPDQYFNIQNIIRFKQQIFTMIKPQHTLKMDLQRDNTGFNTFWPQYYLSFKQDERQIINAKRTTARPISTFLISLSPKKFQQQSDQYLGKMKSNAYGDKQYVYGPGLNPKNASQRGVQPREMLGTIVYQSNFFNNGRPRQFMVFCLKNNVKYYNLLNTKKYQQQIGLDELYKIQQNKKYINVYKNKKPVWSEQLGGFMLNFKGRVSCPSIKNFILEDIYDNQAMIFGKKDQNDFTVEINDKISVFMAFAIVLSTFDTKIICQ